MCASILNSYQDRVTGLHVRDGYTDRGRRLYARCCRWRRTDKSNSFRLLQKDLCALLLCPRRRLSSFFRFFFLLLPAVCYLHHRPAFNLAPSDGHSTPLPSFIHDTDLVPCLHFRQVFGTAVFHEDIGMDRAGIDTERSWGNVLRGHDFGLDQRQAQGRGADEDAFSFLVICV